MKKFIIIPLLAFLLIALAACSSKTSETGVENQTNVQNQNAETYTNEVIHNTEVSTTEPTTQEKGSDSTSSESTKTSSPVPTTGSDETTKAAVHSTKPSLEAETSTENTSEDENGYNEEEDRNSVAHAGEKDPEYTAEENTTESGYNEEEDRNSVAHAGEKESDYTAEESTSEAN